MEIATQSFLGRSDLPRGLRNNNPLNLVKTSIPWQGKLPGNDPRFEQFRTLGYGIRAGLLDLYNDYYQDGQQTLIDLISEFAPPNENDTAAYIQYVANNTGLMANQKFNANKLPEIAYYMAVLENGQQFAGYLNINDFKKIYNGLALQRGAPQAKQSKNINPFVVGLAYWLLN